MERIFNVRLRTLVSVVAIGLVAATIWSAVALAGGGSSGSSNDVADPDPAVAFVQGDGDGPRAEDCPERENDGEEGAGQSADV